MELGPSHVVWLFISWFKMNIAILVLLVETNESRYYLTFYSSLKTRQCERALILDLRSSPIFSTSSETSFRRNKLSTRRTFREQPNNFVCRVCVCDRVTRKEEVTVTLALNNESIAVYIRKIVSI